MPERLMCPGCGRRVRVPDELIGQPVQCPACKVIFTSEDADEAPPPPIGPAVRRKAQPPPLPDEDEEDVVEEAPPEEDFEDEDDRASEPARSAGRSGAGR